jgi:hypothetical protein
MTDEETYHWRQAMTTVEASLRDPREVLDGAVFDGSARSVGEIGDTEV